MDLPTVNKNYFQERSGVLKVAQLLNNLGLIFRETLNADLGIDGQVEYVTNGKATGKIIAVQIKSGKSYFIDKGNHWACYINKKHQQYWQNFPLPVIIMLHNPEDDKIYFADARYYLNISEKEYNYLPIYKNSILNESTKEVLFGTCGPIGDKFLSIPEILVKMINSTNTSISFPVSYFDLFINGLVNLDRHLFFSIDMALDIAQCLID